MDSIGAWKPRSFFPAFPRGIPPSDQLRSFTAGKQFLPYIMPEPGHHREPVPPPVGRQPSG
jgi:hypothetical protein